MDSYHLRAGHDAMPANRPDVKVAIQGQGKSLRRHLIWYVG